MIITGLRGYSGRSSRVHVNSTADRHRTVPSARKTQTKVPCSTCVLTSLQDAGIGWNAGTMSYVYPYRCCRAGVCGVERALEGVE